MCKYERAHASKYIFCLQTNQWVKVTRIIPSVRLKPWTKMERRTFASCIFAIIAFFASLCILVAHINETNKILTIVVSSVWSTNTQPLTLSILTLSILRWTLQSRTGSISSPSAAACWAAWWWPGWWCAACSTLSPRGSEGWKRARGRSECSSSTCRAWPWTASTTMKRRRTIQSAPHRCQLRRSWFDFLHHGCSCFILNWKALPRRNFDGNGKTEMITQCGICLENFTGKEEVFLIHIKTLTHNKQTNKQTN